MPKNQVGNYSHMLVRLVSLVVFFSLMLSCANIPEHNESLSMPTESENIDKQGSNAATAAQTEKNTGIPAFRASLNDDVTIIADPQPAKTMTHQTAMIPKIPLNTFAHQTRQGLKMTLTDANLFNPNSTDLSATARGKLAALAAFLQANPKRQVIIEGYASGTGSKDYLFGLARRYAQTVRFTLVNQAVASNRVQVRLGNQRPANNHQRVEILVLN